MPIEPTLNARNDENRPAAEAATNGESVADLKCEIERLRAQLVRATADAVAYRQAAYAMLNERVPYAPPTGDELHDLLHGSRGQAIAEIIAELEREGEG